jgi:UDP-3-O-[3-hydroxymyristoyl] glucosamine N-acyltransferase
MAGVKDDIPANARWGGIFARPTKQWFREILAVERLAGTAKDSHDRDPKAGEKD